MKKDTKKHFANKEKKLLSDILPFLKRSDRVLKVGNGFGYLSTYISPHVSAIEIYELAIFKDTINKSNVHIYDGKKLPVDDKSFDVAIFNLVFHHIPNNMEYMKHVISKTKRSIVLQEQTYDNIFQKIQLVWRDLYINLRAGTPCKIYWRSYLKRKNVEAEFTELGLKLAHRSTKRSHSYYKAVIVFEII